MKIEDVKRNLNKMVVYQGKKDTYRLTACILRKDDEKGLFYQAEISDIKSGRSLLYCRLEDVAEVTNE